MEHKDYKCECSVPGFCSRHKKEKNNALFAICKEESTRGQRYRKLFDQQAGLLPQDPPPAHHISLFSKSVNFASAMTKHAWHGFPVASEKDYQKRVEICESCEFYTKAEATCSQCGCRIARDPNNQLVPAKAMFAEAQCPLEPPKWLPVIGESGEGKNVGDSSAKHCCGG